MRVKSESRGRETLVRGEARKCRSPRYFQPVELFASPRRRGDVQGTSCTSTPGKTTTTFSLSSVVKGQGGRLRAHCTITCSDCVALRCVASSNSFPFLSAVSFSPRLNCTVPCSVQQVLRAPVPVPSNKTPYESSHVFVFVFVFSYKKWRCLKLALKFPRE